MALYPHQITVAVTGASGFIASEIVAQLLGRGYTVHGTVRRAPCQSTTGHLTSLPGAERLKLFEADLLDSRSFDAAFVGCQVVIHTASPVSADPHLPPEVAYVEPAVSGTNNVLNAIERSAPTVKQIVLTSSIAAISSNAGKLPESYVYSDKDWSPVDRLKELGRWYSVGKTLAEKAAWDHPLVTSKKAKLVVICPGFVLGAISNPKHADGTPKKWLAALKGNWTEIPNRSTVPVDVYDVAKAHLRAFEDNEAQGRYPVVYGTFTHKEVVEAFHRVGNYPNLPGDLEDKPYTQGVDLWNTERTSKLIGGYSTLDQTCRAMANSFISLGLLDEFGKE